MIFRLQIFFIAVSALTFIFVVRKIRKLKLNIDDSIIWIIWSLVLLVLSIFPSIAIKISAALGFESPSNFILCFFIFFLYILMFYQTITISNLKEKNKAMVQKLSLVEHEKNRGENE